MATHMAAPTMIEETMVAVSVIPLATSSRMVMPISVMPDSGDQLVRPMHSERTTPATQIHSVPSSAITPPRSQVISSVDRMAVTSSTTKAPATAQ